MEITITLLQQKFSRFNEQMFEGKLPMPVFALSNAKTFMGQCAYKKRRLADGRIVKYDFRIRINTRISMSEEELDDTLIHELIHYYIGYHQLQDTSAHGRLFCSIMNQINERFGRHLTIAHRGTREQNEQAVDQRAHYRVVAVVTFHDGRIGMKVLPRVLPSILKYYNGVLHSRDVRHVQLYMAYDAFFNRYPNSSALNVHFVDKDMLDEHLKGAEVLGCDGRTITRG